ncbi:hypothetical protein HHI36_018335 [Cryptolaemus montrouzieri]|uniref:adenylate cyclase n=1 Tax=Cryptolaemus montrouzieri TaxID=559131 RepID=A0ABD2P009_9CUCU
MENPDDLEYANVINVRQSIHKIKNKLNTSGKEEQEDVKDDREWILPHLRKIFNSEDLQSLFKIYTQRLNQAFFSLLMLLQTLLFSLHFVVIFIFSSDHSSDILDLILYAVMFCSSIGMFFVTDGCGRINLEERTLKQITIISFLLLNLVNLVVPLYNVLSADVQLRPAYTTHIIICCYVFFFISNIAVTIALGLITSILHVLLLVLITYKDQSSSVLVDRILSDIIYLICLNGLGIYYRYLDEIIKRKSFLDRRACVIYNRHLQFQEEEEKHLMDTLIPSYVVDNIRENILDYWDNLENFSTSTPVEYKTSFTQTFDNVTILFADVVNYTEMTVKLNINQLLETLNELFGSFDVVSEKLKVLRIKFLGDCYYCVAGLPPDPPENHAEACVDLGLEMIKIIAGVRRRKNININMRIGVHTGKIISGIIGFQKIHFDIWSKDVSLANQMETEGVPGKVHLTQQTKDLLIKRYNIEPTEKGETVPLFKKIGLKTYLVTPENRNSSSDTTNIFVKNRTNTMTNTKRSSNSRTATRSSKSIGSNANKVDTVQEDVESAPKKVVQYYGLIESSYIDEEKNNYDNGNSSPRRTPENTTSRISERLESRDSQRRTAFMNSNIKRYKDTMKETYDEMKVAIEHMSLSKYQQWIEFEDIHPVTLLFTKKHHELRFLKMRDPLFKYYLISEVFLVIFLYVIQNLTLASWNWKSYWVFSTLAILIFVFIPLMWIDHFSKKKLNRVLRSFVNLSRTLNNSTLARFTIYIIVCTLFTLCVFSELIKCRNRYDDRDSLEEEHVQMKSFLLLLSSDNDYGICIVPWHMTQTCALAIIVSFLFLRMLMWVKFVYAVVITALYSVCVWYFSDDIFKESSETFNNGIDPKVSHILSVVFLTITLHIIDRQTEYMNRLDFLWNENLNDEQAKIESRYIINKMLLNNVLPEHLAEMYLDIKRPPAALYHEKYANVAVMFASVVGYEIEDISDDDLLTIMTEIIGNFDKVLAFFYFIFLTSIPR